MKHPLRRKTPVDMHRMSSWVTTFSGYRHPITEQRIERWFTQFSSEDRDLAARILDCVEFVTHVQISTAFKSILSSLDGWHIDEARRRGIWRFVPFSTSAGESGDTMLHKFRWANNLNHRKYDELFIYKSELLQAPLNPQDSVVFVDNFAGTGQQACKAWDETIQELLPGNPNAYLILVMASNCARERIERETELMVNPYSLLSEDDNIFSPRCSHFTPKEKKTILKYCRKASNQHPRGHGDCGFVVVFAHNCPNDSIPILHVFRKGWEGLFRRYD